MGLRVCKYQIFDDLYVKHVERILRFDLTLYHAMISASQLLQNKFILTWSRSPLKKTITHETPCILQWKLTGNNVVDVIYGCVPFYMTKTL